MSVGLLARKVTEGFVYNNFQEKLDLAQLRGDKILILIRISVWIQDKIERFFTIAR